jgi:hypothetical protein
LLCGSLSKFKKIPLNPEITGILVRDGVTQACQHVILNLVEKGFIVLPATP